MIKRQFFLFLAAASRWLKWVPFVPRPIPVTASGVIYWHGVYDDYDQYLGGALLVVEDRSWLLSETTYRSFERSLGGSQSWLCPAPSQVPTIFNRFNADLFSDIRKVKGAFQVTRSHLPGVYLPFRVTYEELAKAAARSQ